MGGALDSEVFEAEVNSVEVLADDVIPVFGCGRQNAQEVEPGGETERPSAVLGKHRRIVAPQLSRVDSRGGG